MQAACLVSRRLHSRPRRLVLWDEDEVIGKSSAILGLASGTSQELKLRVPSRDANLRHGSENQIHAQPVGAGGQSGEQMDR